MRKLVAAVVLVIATLAGLVTPAYATTSQHHSSITSVSAEQFIAEVQARNRILTHAPLFAGETIHLYLDGMEFTVTKADDNGGGTIAYITPFLPCSLLHHFVVFTVG